MDVKVATVEHDGAYELSRSELNRAHVFDTSPNATDQGVFNLRNVLAPGYGQGDIGSNCVLQKAVLSDALVKKTGGLLGQLLAAHH
jgi:hypothetical protein